MSSKATGGRHLKTPALKKYKKFLVIAGTTLTLLIVLSIVAYNTAVDRMYYLHSALASTMSTLESKYERAESILKLSAGIIDETNNLTQTLAKATFNEIQDIQTALDSLEQDNIDFYLFDPSGTLYTAKGAKPLTLPEPQLEQLKRDSSLSIESEESNTDYQCYKIPQGLLISANRTPAAISAKSAITGISDRFDYYIASASDRTIVYSSKNALIGSCAPDTLDSSLLGITDNRRNKNEGYTFGFADLGTDRSYCLSYNNNETIFGLYCKTSAIASDIINELTAPFAVLIGTYAVILVFFFSLWKNADKNSDEKKKKWIRVFRTNSFVESSHASHLTGFVLFAAIAALLFNALFLSCSSYSQQSALATKNLDMLSENIMASESDKDTITSFIKNYLKAGAECLANLCALNPELYKHEKLKSYAVGSFKEISIYDKDGILESSSGDYTGYPLTKDESDPISAAWRVLTDSTDYIFKEYDDNSGRYLLAHKRKDVPGIICIIYENPDLTRILKYFSKEEAIRGTDFGNATTFFVKLTDNSKTYMIEPYSTQIEITDIKIPEEMTKDNYSGMLILNGAYSYVNTRNDGGISVTSSIDCYLLNMKRLSDLLVLLAGFILLMLLLFYGSVCRPENTEDVSEDAEQPEKTLTTDRNKKSMFADAFFRKMIKLLFAVLAVGYCFMLLKENLGNQSMLDFILRGNWDKGINLFSINASIIIAVATVVLLFLLRKLLLFVGKSIGSKGLTVCTIVISILKFLCLFFIIGYTLYQFGVNTTALLASAGLVGLVIGIAAKDIFGDLIAGLFLIFEGNIKVGDFIKYKDFRGEVAEMGVRVTVIKRYNTKLIVNNSDIKQFYRLSDELGGAWVEIDVGPNEDIEKIKKLIKDSSKWYQSRIPTLKGGPYFLNVSRFDASSITICLFGPSTDERSGSTKRRILLNTIELFRNNGITLGKNVMKIELQQEKTGIGQITDTDTPPDIDLDTNPNNTPTA